LDGFEKYVSLAIVARNLQKIGAELQKKALAEEQRQNRRRLQQAA
jgi:hypothetical protein